MNLLKRFLGHNSAPWGRIWTRIGRNSSINLPDLSEPSQTTKIHRNNKVLETIFFKEKSLGILNKTPFEQGSTPLLAPLKGPNKLHRVKHLATFDFKIGLRSSKHSLEPNLRPHGLTFWEKI